MSNKATLYVNGKGTEVEVGTLLSAVISQETPCGGHGNCGKCKVKASGRLSEPSELERNRLGDGDLNCGIRLACQTRVLGDAEIELDREGDGERIELGGDLPRHVHAPIFKCYGLAIDLGTTTIAARLYDADGKLLAETGIQNPQGKLGADVISRIECAIGGRLSELAELARTGISTLVTLVSENAGINAREIDAAVITGNTVMLSLLFALDVTSFSRAPFAASRLFGETTNAKELNLTCFCESTPIYIPPCFSAFVGADTATACLATELAQKENAILCDIGTNGEIALARGGRITVCSTAAGPAFEGVGISCGMRSMRGAVDRVRVIDGGLSFSTVDNAPAVGICGSGLIELASSLLSLEILDESGFLENARYSITRDVVITQGDIRALQLAKSAIAAGIQTLMRTLRISSDNLSALYLAGGFGSALDLCAAGAIGLLPSASLSKSIVVGNAALCGASLLLLSAEQRKRVESLVASATHLELSGNPTFAALYTEGMIFSPI